MKIKDTEETDCQDITDSGICILNTLNRSEIEQGFIESLLSVGQYEDLNKLVTSGQLKTELSKEINSAVIAIKARGDEVNYRSLNNELAESGSELTQNIAQRFDLKPPRAEDELPAHWARLLIELIKTEPEEPAEPDAWAALSNGNIADTSKIDALKEQAKGAVYVLDGMALLGQLTLLFTRYNMGKTLLTMWMIVQTIKAGRMDADNIMYINFDDSFDGSITKAEIAAEYGFKMVVPGVEGALNAGQIVDAMAYMGTHGKAHNRVIILDTLKKFVDTMSKTEARAFNSKMRSFTQAGGTVVALAHTNKNKDGDGKSVAEGVGDFASDFDCVYVGEFDTPTDEPKRQVTFRNEKLRGPIKLKVSFSYDASENATWMQRFESVQMLGAKQAELNVTALMANDQRKQDKHVIDYIINQLAEIGPLPKSALIRNNLDGKTGSAGERTKVIERYGPRAALPELQFWGESKGNTGGYNVYLLTDEDRENESCTA